MVGRFRFGTLKVAQGCICWIVGFGMGVLAKPQMIGRCADAVRVYLDTPVTGLELAILVAGAGVLLGGSHLAKVRHPKG